MRTFGFWIVWLKIASILFAVFGLIIAVFNQTELFNLAFNNWINPVFGDVIQSAKGALQFQKWIYGLLGATCLMVGVLIYSIVKNAFANREKWAWNGLFVGLILWFVVDTPISLYYQVYFNAVFNSALFLAVVLPLFLTRKEFKEK